MKANKAKLMDVKGKMPYESPSVKKQHVELEYRVAAGSVNESWNTETQGQDLEW